jgi:hypothetical protein
MPTFKFTATFTGEIEVEDDDERFLEPCQDEHGNETCDSEPFDLDFALAVLYEDFRDGPMEFIESYDTADITIAYAPT